MKKDKLSTEKSVKDIRKIKSIERLDFIIKDLGLDNVSQLSEKLGYNRPEKLYKITRGENSISKKLAEEINSVFPKYDIDWLLTGEGEMIKSGNFISNTNGNVVIGDHNKANNIQTEEKVSSKIKIPYYDVDFAGGWSSEELFSNAYPSYYISAPEFERAEFACNLRGHSISKRVKSGSIVGLKEIHDWQTYFPTNELYGVITKNDLRTIKIVKRSKEEGFLDLIPDALPEYNDPPYEIERVPIDFIQKMFQVVAWGFYERLVM